MKQLRCSNENCILNRNTITEDIEKCPVCGFEMIEIIQKNWLEEIAEDEALWIPDGETAYPFVISAEYKRLRGLCKKRDAFGTLLCLKDSFEAILKYMTLVSYAWAREKTDEVFESENISKITTPNPSFGTWLELARIIVKSLDETDNKLHMDIPLEKIRKLYGKNDIVKWRNDNIGHGVMSLEEDEDFREDIRSMISRLKELMTDIDGSLKNHDLYAFTETGKISLIGADAVHAIKSEDKIFVKIGDEEIPLSPFITIYKDDKGRCGVFFFDNQKKVTLSVFQAYANGRMDNRNDSYFEKLRRCLDSSGKDLDIAADNRYKTAEEYRELDVMTGGKDFVVPGHLLSWLRSCIERHEKGIFLLKMNRGTGKSTFTEKLNTLFEKPLVIDDGIQVRTYHLGRTQFGGDSDMVSYTEYMWGKDYNGTMYPGIKKVADLDKEEKDPARAFAGFLEDVLRSREYKGSAEKILMVFDGLDETNNKEIRSRFPSEEMLGKGIYILFTSRDPKTEDLPEEISEYINGLECTEEKTFGADGEENREFLREYIDHEKISGIYEERLIELAHERILELGILCRLLKKGVNVEELNDSEKIIKKYLEIISEGYGEKDSARLREVLTILAVLGEMRPLTLREIGEISSENTVTLRLIGIINDLMPLIRIERTEQTVWKSAGDEKKEKLVETVNIYEIANSDLAEELKKQIPELEEVIRDVVQLAMAGMKEGVPESYSGDEAASTHITELALMLPEKTEAMGEGRIEVLNEFCIKADESAEYLHERECLSDYTFQSYLLHKEENGESDPDTLAVLNNLALNKMALGDYQRAKELFEEIYEKCKEIRGDYNHDTTVVLNNLALAIETLGDYQRAKELFKEVYKKRKDILGEDHPDTINALGNLACAIGLLGDHQREKELQEVVYKRSTNILGENHPDTITVLNNLAGSLDKLGDHQRAKELFEEVYKKRKDILGEDHPDTIASLNNVAATIGELGNHQKEKELLEEVYNKWKKILGEDHPYTITSLGNLAYTLGILGDYQRSKEIYEEVYKKSKEVFGENHTDTISALNNLALNIMALGDYQQAKELAEEVLKKKKEILGEDHPDTLYTMTNLASISGKLGDHQHAKEITEEVYKKSQEAYIKSKEILGEDHPDTITLLDILSDTLLELGEYRRAKKLKREVLKRRKKIIRSNKKP